ncbi:hypothetical protein, partial [Burkholderia gladioli]|uniref:hypothetical protein n=1 Tax=Burkholderia gladioli TaxID=28095 RepID=UPI0034DABD45
AVVMASRRMAPRRSGESSAPFDEAFGSGMSGVSGAAWGGVRVVGLADRKAVQGVDACSARLLSTRRCAANEESRYAKRLGCDAGEVAWRGIRGRRAKRAATARSRRYVLLDMTDEAIPMRCGPAANVPARP